MDEFLHEVKSVTLANTTPPTPPRKGAAATAAAAAAAAAATAAAAGAGSSRYDSAGLTGEASRRAEQTEAAAAFNAQFGGMCAAVRSGVLPARYFGPPPSPPQRRIKQLLPVTDFDVAFGDGQFSEEELYKPYERSGECQPAVALALVEQPDGTTVSPPPSLPITPTVAATALTTALVLVPSPVVALARKVYATVRLRSRDYGVDSLCRARQPPTPFFREGSDGKTKHMHSTCLTRPNLGHPTARDR